MRDEDFERLYAAEAPGLFSFLAYRTGDRALAQDLLADAFARVLRARRRYERRRRSGRVGRARRRYDRRRGSEKTWLYAIALNVLRDHARREGARVRAA